MLIARCCFAGVGLGVLGCFGVGYGGFWWVVCFGVRVLFLCLLTLFFRVLVLRFLAVICGCWLSVVWCVAVGFARAVLVGGVCGVGFRVFVGLVFECLRVWCFGGLLSFELVVGFVWLLTLVLGGAGLRFLTGWGWWFPVVCVRYMAVAGWCRIGGLVRLFPEWVAAGLGWF